MANRLKVAEAVAIRTLVERGWSYRRIARELGVHRETVARHARGADTWGRKPAKAPTGSDPPGAAERADESAFGRESKPAKAPIGSEAPTRSECEPHRELILAKLEQGLSAQRIWQDLRSEHGIEVSYYSVRRFVRLLGHASPLPYRRLECAPGVEAQLDFGRAAPVVGENGRRRRTWFVRIVLSHSRKGYTESVFRQTTDELIRCLENAFDAFGGVPQTLVFDNAKAAVIQPDWYDPELNPKLEAFCQHAGTVLLPTKPRTPRHKGKVESNIDYVKDNALKGRHFASLAAQNEHLARWEATVADTRLHGTTRRQVKQVFEEVERPALKPLPAERFPFFQEATRIVHRDGHVEVAKAYYSLPPEFVGRTVWVRWDARLVRIFDQRLQPIIVHVRLEPGKFGTAPKHLHPHKVSAVERGAGDMLHRTSLIGPQTHGWAKAMLDARGIEGVRVLIGLHALAKQHPSSVLEDACDIAHSHGAYRLRAVRELIKRRGPKQDRFEFLEAHPIIRTLGEYTEAARRAIYQQGAPFHSPAITVTARPDVTSAGDLGPLHRPRSWTPGLPPEGLGGQDIHFMRRSR
jgi:transposase